ncbi:hypothetical protein EVC62_09695 [Salinicola endophyticus]|uniref:Phosphate ABC transporter substrate-binding protein n=1 Tax=Salinicola endophyticus TaxID=1949083 RepID=A0ABY8FG09_9GAMM|nr:hypothetical protein [Salinicola endophyticus]WFF41749.1 hypothetical protein EVC62_09695 [Salinicola endophyticus]
MRCCLLVALLSLVMPAMADIAIVVNTGSGVSHLTRSDAVNIFMGRYRKLPSGNPALPLDVAPFKARFYRALVNKNLAEINSYWARLVFSGENSPPQQVATVAEMRQIVTSNPGAVGYLDSREVSPDLHVVLILSE